MKITQRSFTTRLVVSVTLIFFSLLMLQITLQYIPAGRELAFLRIKQEALLKPFYFESFYTHVYSSMFALLAGFTQFSVQIRRDYKKLHRAMGYIYVLVVLVFSGPTGIYMGVYANGGWSSQLAFVLLAILWWLFTFLAMKSAWQGDFQSHQKWMIRSYALTLSAITLRLWKWGIVAVFEPRPMDVYRWVAWLGWVINLLVAEGFIKRMNSVRSLPL